MKRLMAAILWAWAMLTVAAQAQQSGQDVVWVQIEAHPSLAVAQQRAQIYADALADVNGFSLGGSWYGIVLGPYTRPDAERVLQVYRANRQIPQDSFIALSRNLGNQFWPAGNTAPTAPVAAAPAVPQPQAPAVVAATPQPADETRAEALRSESGLTADERKDLQIALKAAGFYESTIDGAFGRGTRASMSAWQAANGYEDTGVLTTLQRDALMDEYNQPLISTGMALVRDDGAGIEMQVPTKAVRFARYESPFAQYDSISDLGARVLLISQPGNEATLAGLYDIMQTLAIVPLEGPRERGASSFTLEGRNRDIVSYTEASLRNGEIKGFTLIWPTGDEARRLRVLAAMRDSFTRLDGVLDPGAGGTVEQRIDLVSGLEVRKPRLARTGFYINGDGDLLTVAEAVTNCTRITVDQDHPADVLARDDASGLAVLRPRDRLAPMSVALFADEEPRLQSDISVAGYSYEGLLGAPTLTFGTLADSRGLGGEPQVSRLDLDALPGDAGGPVMDRGGNVVGMLLPPPNTGQTLPKGVSFASDVSAMGAVAQKAGLSLSSGPRRTPMSPDELNRQINGMTVLVSCWD